MKYFTLLFCLVLLAIGCNPAPAGYGDLYKPAKVVKELHYYASENEGVIDFDPSRFYKRLEIHYDKEGNEVRILESYGNRNQVDRHRAMDSRQRLVSQHTLLQSGDEQLELKEELLEAQDDRYILLRFESRQPELKDTLIYTYQGNEELITLNGRLLQKTLRNEYLQPHCVENYNDQGELELRIDYAYQLKTLLARRLSHASSAQANDLKERYEYMELDKYGNWTQSCLYENDSLTTVICREINY